MTQVITPPEPIANLVLRPGAPVPPTVGRVARKYSTMRGALWVEAGVLVIIAVGLVVFELLARLGAGDVGVIVAVALALGPAPALFALGLWLDRFEPEPVWLLMRTFLWGAAVAIMVASVVNSSVAVVAGQGAAAVVSAPLIEELMKGMAVYWVFRRRSEHLNGVTDGIVYALFVGLGFAIVENVDYYAQGLATEGISGLAITFVLRGLMTPFLHPFFTMFTGIALGMAVSRTGSVRVLLPLCGYGMAVFTHALWNSGIGMVLYPIVFVPAFVVVAVLMVRGRTKQRTMLLTHVGPELTVGLLTSPQFARLHEGGGGLREYLEALRSSDNPLHAWRRLHHAAYALASHRDAVARRTRAGAAPTQQDAVVDHELRAHVWAARHMLPGGGERRCITSG